MIRFGPWSTILGLSATFGLAVSVALWRTRTNTAANRLLALLLLAISLQLMPYVIGYAGFYDTWPWLSFLPFGATLAIGPLLYLHVTRLTSRDMPVGWWRHLMPALLQFLYYTSVFVFPLSVKDVWDDQVHEPYLYPVETLAILISMTVYLRLAWRRHHAYQHWLADHISNRSDFRLDWLRNFIIALAANFVAWTLTSIATKLAHLNYFERFPFYLGLALLVFYLGLEGWRHADRHYPLPMDADESSEPLEMDSTANESRDWSGQGEAWLKTTREAGWWRDADLSLERLARHLGTNTAYLSRAFNSGLGQNFSEVIAGLRVTDVKHVITEDASRDLLDIALSAGFSSKSSFNRVFKSQTGETPSQFRLRARRERPNP